MITLEQFVRAIDALQAQMDEDTQKADKLGEVFTDAFSANLLWDNAQVCDALTDTLSAYMGDEDDWVSYYIYELDFGRTYKPGKIKDADGVDIALSSAHELYDFLAENKSPE